LEHFKIHFVTHVLKEIYENKELLNCHESCIKYWAAVLRRLEDKTEVEELIDKYEASRPARRNTLTSSDDEDKKKSKRSPSEDGLAKGDKSPENYDSEGEDKPSSSEDSSSDEEKTKTN
jgi:hypothetical protein